MEMDQATYQRWWALHLRAARGESLDPGEQALFESGRRQLEQEEDLSGQGNELSRAHADLSALESERSSLEARRRQLEAEITRLEAALNPPVRQPSGVKG